jgi:hypothetical protein
VIFTAVLAFVVCVGVSANGYTIHPTHPRIFITDRQAFRDRINNDTNLRSIFDSSKADTSGRLPSDNGWQNWNNPLVMQMNAMIYVVDQETAYLDKARLYLEYFANGDWEVHEDENDRHWIWPLIVKSMSITYDWLYDVLSEPERIKYGNYIVTTGDKIYTYCRYGTWSDQCSDYDNQFYWHQGRLVFGGVALYNDGIDDSSAIGYLDDSESWLKDHMLPATNQVGIDGGWSEGLGYNGMTVPMFAEMIENWKVAAGEDLFSSSTYLQYNSEWILHSITPYDSNYVEIANISMQTSSNNNYGSAIGLMAALTGARYGGGFAQYIVEDVFPSGYGFHNFPYLLWYDSSVPAVNLSTVELAKHFRGIGHVLMRTGFDSDSTFALFKSGNMFASHQHQEQNEFLIHRKGRLAVESAHYGYDETIYHNCMLIDGDQIRPPRTQYYEIIEGTERDTGDITAYEHTGDYTFAVGDAKNAYESSKVTECLRYFVFLRPDYFVVFDRVGATSASYAKKWLIHSINSPVISTDLITITESNGKLFSKTILPEAVNINSYSEQGRCRIEVTPVTSNADDLFLHVLYPTDLGGSMPSTQTVSATGMTGVNFADRLILFGTEGKVYDNTISYSFSTSVSTKHLIADVKPDTSYAVMTNSGTIGVRSSANGVLYFETADTGVVPVNISKLSGDIDIDFDIDLHDYAIFALAWLSEPADGNWNASCDISEPSDDIIDLIDLEMFIGE